MLTPSYSLSDIQNVADALEGECTYFHGSVVGADGQLTPKLMLEAFAVIQSHYKTLEAYMAAVQCDTDLGYDADRFLFLP